MGVNAQDKGEQISEHVKELHRDQETAEKGTWYHIKAVVETKTIIYSLTCDEIYNNEKHAFAGRCFQLSAGKDYSARRFPSSINFWQPEDRGKEYLLILYDIVSEKEK